MHGPPPVPVEMALWRVRREEVHDGRACVADGVVARERSRGGGCVGDFVQERVGHGAGVAVQFDKVAAFGVFLQFQRVDEGLRGDGLVRDRVALEGWGEGRLGGVDCGSHFLLCWEVLLFGFSPSWFLSCSAVGVRVRGEGFCG